MSITASAPYAAAGKVFTAHNAADQFWNGTAYENYNASNVASYSITPTDNGGSCTASIPDTAVRYRLRLSTAFTTILWNEAVQKSSGLTTEQAAKINRIVVTPAGGVVLSNYPPSLQTTVPQPGVGAFAPGGRNEVGAAALRLTITQAAHWFCWHAW